jgi:hypothetical protein
MPRMYNFRHCSVCGFTGHDRRGHATAARDAIQFQTDVCHALGVPISNGHPALSDDDMTDHIRLLVDRARRLSLAAPIPLEDRPSPRGLSIWERIRTQPPPTDDGVD